jgi:hypothetical protein
MKTRIILMSASALTLAWCGAAAAQTSGGSTSSTTTQGVTTVPEVVDTGERRSTRPA